MIEQLEYIGPLGIPLLLLSLVGMAIIVEKSVFHLKLPKIDSCPVLAGLIKTLEKNKTQSKQIRDEIATHLLMEAKRPHDFGIKLLRIVAVTSPMFGLLGTVIGIISAFKTISLHDGPVYPALIADGLWVAMTTTAVGLIIALPCLIAAFLFARASEKRIAIYQSRLNKLSLEIEGVQL